ncbi:MAG TPA: Uma2 family endonuclease [Thermoanaerobaculia bacterium]|jgi:Uma2 family endonuclease|nr:Uma2 family endonuclease [Thermoanaerobaculia bacterium]
MSVALLKEPPLSPFPDLGPYRREDYEALPGEPRCELIHGRFYVSPSPSIVHQVVAGLLYQHLYGIARTTGGKAYIAPLDVNLADHSVVQPDILYVSSRRRAILQERVEGVPDLVAEVLSPGTARRDRGEKLILYAEMGLPEYWIADGAERQIEFLVNEGGRFVVALPENGVYRSRALPEIHLDLAAFWETVEEDLA